MTDMAVVATAVVAVMVHICLLLSALDCGCVSVSCLSFYLDCPSMTDYNLEL